MTAAETKTSRAKEPEAEEPHAASWPLVVTRSVLLAGFLATIPSILWWEHGRLAFWTAAIAALPLFWVLGGYHLWRRVCPLSLVAQLPRMLGLGGKRKIRGWAEERFFELQLGLMLVALSLRLIATNGTPWALAGFLGLVVVSALAIGLVYTGKTWCNVICPVGMVERLYTEPSRLAGESNSQCARCTACKKHCPDIDLEQGYWKEHQLGGRRLAYYAWPGIVVAFYLYYWLQAGTWDAYFDGAWTREDGQAAGWLGPGFFFLGEVPKLVAAPLTLLAGGALSWVVFSALERALSTRMAIPELRLRHRMFALAGFVGFNAFYFFAGQPSLRLLPRWVQVGFALAVVMASTMLLARRFGRSEEDYVHEKAARGILKRWQWGDKPAGQDLRQVYVVHAERSREQESRLGAYKEMLRELVADGVIDAQDLKVLAGLRGQLGLTDKDHEKVVAQLGAEDRRLFDPAHRSSVEKRLQLEQYRADLARVVMVAANAGGRPDPGTLDALRFEHRIRQDEHDALMAELVDAQGPVTAAVRELLKETTVWRQAAGACQALIAAQGASRTLAYLVELLAWSLQDRVRQALSMLGSFVDPGALDRATRGLFGPEPDAARSALEGLLPASLQPLVAMLGAGPLPVDGQEPMRAIAPLAGHPSFYVRAAAAVALSRAQRDPEIRALVRVATRDPSAFVRESAVRALAAIGQLGTEGVQAAMADPDPRVPRAALGGREPAQEGGRARPMTGDYATLDTRAQIASLTTLEKMIFLREVPIFGDLDPDDLEEMTGLTAERRFKPGEHLCLEGLGGQEVFVLVYGRVKAWRAGADGGEVVLGESGPGDSVGEMSAIDAAPRVASVTALEPTRALVLGAHDFQQLLGWRPSLAQGVLVRMVRRLRGMIEERATGQRA
jgi:HEAT repeat protein